MSDVPSTWLENLFDHNIDLVYRRVFLGEISDDSCLEATKSMYALESKDPESVVELFINSGGGCVASTLGIMDIMGTLSCPVHTFAYGNCMSAAPLLLAAGCKGNRWVSPNLNLMVHDGHSELAGSSKDLVADLEHSRSLDKQWYDALSLHTGQEEDFWRGLCTKGCDYYFDAEQAIEFGLADHIWEG